MVDIPVTHVAGVGPAKAKVLAELNICTVGELLHYYPFRFEDRRIRPFETFEDGALVSARAVVEGAAQVRWRSGKATCTARLRIDGRHRLLGVWFNQPYIKTKLIDGRVMVVTGRFNRDKMLLVVSHVELDTTQPAAGQNAWTPIYRVHKGITSPQLQSLIAKALEQYGSQVEELLPFQLAEKYRLVTHANAVRCMHHPSSEEDLRQAHRRLAFEEFFLFQLQLQTFRRQRDSAVRRNALTIPADAWSTFQASLPYTLTNAQSRACVTIAEKLSGPVPMSVLLQGDVGSGKTWVALWSAYAVARDSGQSAIMAPTEILAEQHFREAEARLTPLGIRVALLTGGTPERDRKRILGDLAAGEIALIVGTHALLTANVAFANLRLVITDEQHRFGVEQRSVLRHKGEQPDVLFLSATPIPRTLALAVYGDLDVAVLNELPSGRKPVKTMWWPLKDEQKAIRFIRKQLAAGRQAFIVAPLVEESEAMADLASATELAARLVDQFAGFQLALLHGRMRGAEKEGIMKQFQDKQTQVLVSTTVIEVGIDVPEATVMMIYHAERFGLAQLHQLRGRVGRGRHESYCILLSDAAGQVAKQRLQTMVDTNDGFEIAEKDLSLRGPGEFLGVRQSGLPEFTVGDLSRDLRVMEVARDEALALVNGNDFWLLPAYEPLRAAVETPVFLRYAKD